MENADWLTWPHPPLRHTPAIHPHTPARHHNTDTEQRRDALRNPRKMNTPSPTHQSSCDPEPLSSASTPADQSPATAPSASSSPSNPERPHQDDLFRIIKRRDSTSLALWLSEWADTLPSQKGHHGTFPIQSALEYQWEHGASLLLLAGDNPNRMARYSIHGQLAELAPIPKAYASGFKDFLQKAISLNADFASPHIADQWPLAIAGRIVSSDSVDTAFAEFSTLASHGARLFSLTSTQPEWIRLGMQIARQERTSPGSCLAAANRLFHIATNEPNKDIHSLLRGMSFIASCIRIPIGTENWKFIACPIKDALTQNTEQDPIHQSALSTLAHSFSCGNLELFQSALNELPPDLRIPKAILALKNTYDSQWDDPFGHPDPDRQARTLRIDPKTHLRELNSQKYAAQLQYLRTLFPEGSPDLQNPGRIARFIHHAQIGLAIFASKDPQTTEAAVKSLSENVRFLEHSCDLNRMRDDGQWALSQYLTSAFTQRLEHDLDPRKLRALPLAQHLCNNKEAALILIRNSLADAERAYLEQNTSGANAPKRLGGL